MEIIIRRLPRLYVGGPGQGKGGGERGGGGQTDQETRQGREGARRGV